MASTRYVVRVADIASYDEAGQPVRRVTLPEAELTADEIRQAVARGASVVCLACDRPTPWDDCPYLVRAVEPGLGEVRGQLIAAYVAAGVRVPPICHWREAV